jgi:chromosome segregation ATPase
VITDLKAALAFENTVLEQTVTIERLANALRVPTADSDQLLSEIRKLQRVSAERESQSVENTALSEQLSHTKTRLTDASREAERLRQQLELSERSAGRSLRDLTDLQAESSAKSETIHSLTVSLKSANARAEDSESRQSSLSTQNEDLSRALADLQSASDKTRRRLKAAKEKATEADALKEQVVKLENRITRLNQEVSENARLRGLAEQSEETIQALQLEVSAGAQKGRDLSADNARLRDESGRLQASCDSLKQSTRKLTEQLSACQLRAGESERLNRALSNELEAKEAIAQTLKGIEAENHHLRGENRKLQSQNAELQSRLSDSQIQLESRASSFDRTSSQLRAAQDQIEELESEKKSIAGQLETKALIAHRYETQLKSLRESNEKLRNQPLAHSLQLEVSQLSAENRELRQRLTKSELIQTANDELIARNAKLSDQLRRTEVEIRELDAAKDTLASSLREKNAELSLKLSELEDDRREAVNTAELARALKAAQTDIRRLSRANEQLSTQLRNGESLQAIIAQKDGEIAELRKLCDRQEAILEKLRGKVDVDTVVGRIETALGAFEVGPLTPRRADSIVTRLEAILALIYQINEVFEEQKRSLVRIAGSLPRRTPGSPR